MIFSAIALLPRSASASAVEPARKDTTLHNATRTLIESFGELSRTASKLSEATLKLLEEQERSLREEEESRDRKESAGQPHAEKTAAIQAQNNPDTIAAGPRVFVSDTPVLSENSPLPESGNQASPESYESAGGDGRYMWIPNEDVPTVERFLSGDYMLEYNDSHSRSSEPDLNEMTFWRGDSIPMALHTRRLGRFDRKLYNWLIYPKGTWQLSMTASYGELSTDDSEFLSLIEDVDVNGKSYSVRPAVGYFLRSNLCVGLRLAYTRGEANVNSFNVDIDDDLNFNLHDISFTSEKYSAALFVQQYLGLSRRGRFAVYNEAELSVGSGNKYFTRPFGGDIRQTRSKTQSVNLNYSPGVSILIMKNAAFNLSFGVFGFHLTHEKQWENGEESGSRLTSGINFRFNIFNINFGVSIII